MLLQGRSSMYRVSTSCYHSSYRAVVPDSGTVIHERNGLRKWPKKSRWSQLWSVVAKTSSLITGEYWFSQCHRCRCFVILYRIRLVQLVYELADRDPCGQIQNWQTSGFIGGQKTVFDSKTTIKSDWRSLVEKPTLENLLRYVDSDFSCWILAVNEFSRRTIRLLK